MNERYFTDYCGRGLYDDVYEDHSYYDHCIEIAQRLAIPVRSVLVLGAATGCVLGDFEDAFGVRAHGCEISPWAHARIPWRYRRRIELADMRDYVPDLVRRRRTFDLAFCNALIYLEEADIRPLLAAASFVVGHFHLRSSTTECFEPGDEYRRILQPLAWWDACFRAGGFERTRSRYVWRSTRRGRFRDASMTTAVAAPRARARAKPKW